MLRDCFFGVRRFTDLQAHLDISRAVLAARLTDLVDAGLLERREYRPGRTSTCVTEEAIALWPALYALTRWGEQYRSPNGPRRAVRARRTATPRSTRTAGARAAGPVPAPPNWRSAPAPRPHSAAHDPVSLALRRPHRLLTPLPAG